MGAMLRLSPFDIIKIEESDSGLVSDGVYLSMWCGTSVDIRWRRCAYTSCA
jgi:hypothetical protein